MSLVRLCDKAVVTASPNTTVLEAAKLMQSKHVGCLMVIDRGKVIGILTDRDIVLRGVAAERNLSEIPVRKIMTVNPTTINVNYDVVDAVWLMRTRGVRRLPIVDQHRRVFGIITLDDILAKYGTDAGDLAGTVEKELGLETADRTVKH